MKMTRIAVAAMALATLSLAACKNDKKGADTVVDTVSEVIEENISENVQVDSTFNYNVNFFTTDANKGNGKDSTYMQTPTGLRYAVVKEGTGKQPAATDTVTVHYTGMLTNGQVFDSSISRGEPATFPLNRVIPGWTEGLQTMKEGGITEFYIPSDLGYGPNGTPDGSIPPNAPLIFRVELLKVN